jgi:hypothetical protein
MRVYDLYWYLRDLASRRCVTYLTCPIALGPPEADWCYVCKAKLFLRDWNSVNPPERE